MLHKIFSLFSCTWIIFHKLPKNILCYYHFCKRLLFICWTKNLIKKTNLINKYTRLIYCTSWLYIIFSYLLEICILRHFSCQYVVEIIYLVQTRKLLYRVEKKIKIFTHIDKMILDNHMHTKMYYQIQLCLWDIN